MKMINLIGEKYGKLTVLERANNRITPKGRNVIYWKCCCDCGNLIEVNTSNLRSGHTKSCGCNQQQKSKDDRSRKNNEIKKKPKRTAEDWTPNEISFESEKWMVVDEFPNYRISNYGRVVNAITGQIKKPGIGKRGYPVLSMTKDRKMYLRTVHVMLARAFIPNPNNLPQVNHIDGNKLNYSLDNLEWVSARDNLIHARNTGLHLSDGDKKVAQYSLDGVLIKTYKSASEAARQNNLSACNVSGAARGNTRRKTSGGYYWRYTDGD